MSDLNWNKNEDPAAERSQNDGLGDAGPALFIRSCTCGAKNCGKIIVGMHQPAIRELEGSDELVSIVYMPLSIAQEVVDVIRRLAAEEGIRVL